MVQGKRKYLIVLLILLMGYLGLRQFLRYRLRTYLNTEIKEGIGISHKGLGLELLEGSAYFEHPSINVSPAARLGVVGRLDLRGLQINEIDYFNLLLNGELSISSIALEDLDTQLETKKLEETIALNDTTVVPAKLGITIRLAELMITGGRIRVTDGETKEPLLQLDHLDLAISDVELSDRTLAAKIPFTGKDYDLSAEAIFVKASRWENLSIAKLRGDHSYTYAKTLRYYTAMDRNRLDRNLTTEKDHYDVKVDTLTFHNLGLSNTPDGEKLSFSAQKIGVLGVAAQMYRNKLLPDTQNKKPLYSQALRNAGASLSIDTLSIKKAEYEYIEKVHSDNDGGRLVFSNLDLTVLRLGNTYDEDTQIQMESRFMGVAPFEAKWTFSPKRSDDSFRFRGAISQLPLAAVVPFTLPNARIRLDGKVDNLVFDITGNQWESHTILTGKYRNVKIHMENRHKGKEREVLSGLVNLLVPSSSPNKGNSFEEVRATTARKPNKSPWNYIYKSIEGALIKLFL